MFGTVAAGKSVGGYDTIFEAVPRMGHLKKQTYMPNPAAQKADEKLDREYVTLHNFFGGGANDVMKRLNRIKAETRDI